MGAREQRNAIAETIAGMRTADPIGFWLSIASVATSLAAVIFAAVVLLVGA